MTQKPLARLYIDGKWKEGETFQVCHPQTREVVTTAVSATVEDCRAAVEAAGKAQGAWEALTPTARRDILFKCADILQTEAYTSRIGQYIALETGALQNGFARHSAVLAAHVLREAATLATHIRGETVTSETPGTTFYVQRKAIGVIFAIAPWNAPAPLTARAIAVPLVCGNTVVLKSSELCPYTMSIIVEALVEAGLPKGVINFVHMSRETAPKLVADIIGNPLVRKINFTGSDRVGRILAAEAAKYLKPCVFELGGKAPCVVLNDANVKDAARAIVFGAMFHSGQICMSTERVIVQRSISKELIEAVSAIVPKLATGDNMVESTSIGPVFSEAHAKGVVSLIQEAKNEGAEVLAGDLKNDGALVKPHILLNIKPGMRAWDHESFGPVVGFAVVDTVDEAVELANKTDYSLTAALWTTNLEGLQIASRIRASTVVVNGATFTGEPSFGVFGLGGATGYGRFDVEHWTDKRAIAVRPPNEKYPFVDRLL